jgi:hypothetical protein
MNSENARWLVITSESTQLVSLGTQQEVIEGRNIKFFKNWQFGLKTVKLDTEMNRSSYLST